MSKRRIKKILDSVLVESDILQFPTQQNTKTPVSQETLVKTRESVNKLLGHFNNKTNLKIIEGFKEILDETVAREFTEETLSGIEGLVSEILETLEGDDAPYPLLLEIIGPPTPILVTENALRKIIKKCILENSFLGHAVNKETKNKILEFIEGGKKISTLEELGVGASKKIWVYRFNDKFYAIDENIISPELGEREQGKYYMAEGDAAQDLFKIFELDAESAERFTANFNAILKQAREEELRARGPGDDRLLGNVTNPAALAGTAPHPRVDPRAGTLEVPSVYKN